MKNGDIITTICPYCEAKREAVWHEVMETHNFRGEVIKVMGKFFECLECGGDFDDPKAEYDNVAELYEIYEARTGKKVLPKGCVDNVNISAKHV